MLSTTSARALQAIALIFLIDHVNAFWRMPCRSRSGLARVDPLVSYGTVSEHAHAIHGSSGFSETAGFEQLLAGECTSCEVAQDHSAYWTPALYFQNAAGQYQLVQQVGGMLAYYLLYPNVGNTSLSAFPQGFQMIAGDTYQRNFSYPVPDVPKSNWSGNLTEQAFLRQAALGFNCLNYAGAPEGSLFRHFLPDKAFLDANCKDGVRFELMFPSCWDGVHLDSPDHKSHVAYPSEVMTGNCPEGFNTRLVSLFYETIWNTYEFVGQQGQFVIANGDPTGYGYHGDFIMGWNESFLQSAVDQCTNLSGQIEDCPLFNIQPSSVYGNCNITLPTALQAENVVGPIPTLPGNAAIASGPGYAAYAAGAPPPTGGSNPVPTLSNSPGVVPTSSGQYEVGGVFQQVSVTPSITPAPAAPSGAPPSYFSTQYVTSGQVVQEVLWVEEVVTVTAPAPDRKRHINVHRHGMH